MSTKGLGNKKPESRSHELFIPNPLDYPTLKIHTPAEPPSSFFFFCFRYDRHRPKRCRYAYFVKMHRLGTRSHTLIGSLTRPPTTTVIPYWFKHYVLRQKVNNPNEHSNHYSFDTPLVLKGLLPPAYDEGIHFQRSLKQLRYKTSPLEKYIVSA